MAPVLALATLTVSVYCLAMWGGREVILAKHRSQVNRMRVLHDGRVLKMYGDRNQTTV